MPPKTFTKKLRGKGVIEVDAQIARWRKKLKAQGRVVGAHRAKQLEQQKVRAVTEMSDEQLIQLAKNKFK
jgi:hypothetical protein